MTPPSFKDKQNLLLQRFLNLSAEARYEEVILLGKELPPLAKEHQTPDNLVPGCQSEMFLHSYLKDDLIYFAADADALISRGLAALLVLVYSGETPETVLTSPPNYLDLIGITSSLTPNRANGLYSIHLRMKQQALKMLVEKSKKESKS